MEWNMPSLQKSKIEKHYAKILWTFIGFTVVLVSFILYFSFSKTVITLMPRAEDIALDFALPVENAEVTKNPPSDTRFDGIFLTTTVSGEETSTDVTELDDFSEKATGTVKIINRYSKSQPLVATTRLLSDEGALYRTAGTVTVPSGGEVTVDIIADQPGASQIVGPTHFTIVALWAGIQDQIYAESSVPTSQTGRRSTVATGADIRSAQDDLLRDLKVKAADELARDASLLYPHLDFFQDILQTDVISETADVSPDDQVTAFTTSAEIRVTALVTSRERLESRVLEMLQVALPENMKLAGDQSPTFDFHLENVDPLAQTGTLAGTASAKMVLTLNHPTLERKNVLNLDAQQVRTYFGNFPEIAAVDVHFSPFWIRRTPSLIDHVEIILAQPKISQ
ncbi:MAG: hypothetical protein A3F54_01215 [Candidatus Kerfeldbacteria bacterium RIFCSPHIGHO2_12_FULL_48_17]|uniref:Baseplate protein J-like domain-containing protein n=1 Tax=Candidatus Kerfeldbacteria bacterium RIFCSPHIGHO2_12_FULL_48_17 TaxID=1798542 RepID=A0A1G2AXM0_9BACT|nr:MAG: hypothetical protein A3F54_01215 [Candidatus Kerfeldbacteria bacterium RIFCSPHIGHO2_12_FULL_48_17]